MTFPQIAAEYKMSAEAFIDDQAALGLKFTSYADFQAALKVPEKRQVRKSSNFQ